MKTKVKGLLAFLLVFAVQIAFAQTKTVSGLVSDQDGAPLPGATVLVKGTNKGTTEVSLESINSDKLIVRITDNGEGIQKEHLSRLFERFYRVDQSGSRKQGGSGLGLSIVKHIIDAHNENVYVESKFGIGSEFSFTLTKKI